MADTSSLLQDRVSVYPLLHMGVFGVYSTRLSVDAWNLITRVTTTASSDLPTGPLALSGRPSLPDTTMASRLNDDDDLHEYLVIGDTISLRFGEGTKPELLKKLEMSFNDNHVSTTWKSTELGVKSWAIACDTPIFPNAGDSIKFRVVYAKSHGIPGFQSHAFEEFSLTYKAISCGLLEQRHSGRVEGELPADEHGTSKQTTVTFSQASCVVALRVAPGKIEDLKLAAPSPALSTVLSTRISDALDEVSDTLQILGSTIILLGNAHPLARAILTALSVPYKLLKNVRQFEKSIKSLADAMRTTCKCLMDIRYHTKLASAREMFVAITKTLRDAALFLSWYHEKGCLERATMAQFPKVVESYAEDLIKTKNNFQMAMIMQIARDVNPTMRHDEFLRKRLRPVEEQPLGEGCLKDTRVKILEETRTWIQNIEAKENILWVVGAPGAGKTTIATSIAKGLEAAPFCVKFFCRRDVPDLQNPRNIWRTLAYSLADKHDGIKAGLMRALDQKKSNPQDHSVIEQFQQLIKGSLESDQEETSFRTNKIAYPLVIIDALDECFSADDENWDNLLETLAFWTELPSSFKLIVTSRDFLDIRQTLSGVSRLVKLTTGEEVSENSKSDIKRFFGSKFASIRRKQPFLRARPGPWPDETQIQKLTDYATGLFIWADMVIKYVGIRTSGSNPVKRLEDVLCDIEAQPRGSPRTGTATDRQGQVDRMYARIVFEAFRRSDPDEQKKAKNVLAAVLLAKEPLRKSDLLQLLSSASESNDILASIESTLQEFSPIIHVSEPSGEIRVCHKTVSDCLLAHDRSAAAIKLVVQQWNRRTPPDDEIVYHPDVFVLDCEAENRCLALACLHLINCSTLAWEDVENISRPPRLQNGALYYARRHWIEHIEGAGIGWTQVIPYFKSLANAMEVVYGCFPCHLNNQVKEEAATLTRGLQDTVVCAIRCIDSTSSKVEDVLRELEQNTRSLDIKRGQFQIAKAVAFVLDKGNSASETLDSFLRDQLHPPDQIPPDHGCLEGTRISVLRQAKEWLEDRNRNDNILWIVGAPGAGKSAIATSLFKDFSQAHLCVKVVAKRDISGRRDPKGVWRRLAYGLTSLHIGLKGSILEALCANARTHHFKTASVEEQFRALIVKPLREQQFLSIVVVIDATEDNEDWRALLRTIAGWTCLPRSLKLVVTSRDIPDIRNALQNIRTSIHLTTGSETSGEVRLDIEKFLRTQLEDFELSKDFMEELTGYAGGSFIWAKMVAELVRKAGATHPVSSILNGAHDAGDVDVLYGKMLLDTLGQLDENRRDAARSFLATMILAKNPLRKSDLVELVSRNKTSADEKHRLVDSMVEELSSIISIGENQLLRIPHKSFSDFLLSRERCVAAMKRSFTPLGDPRSFAIRHEEDSANIAISCLQLMESSLKFNACRIGTSHSLNEDIPKLAERISENICSALIYACRFWAEHLRDCNLNNQDVRARVVELLKTLLCKNLLYWLECLSYIKAFSSAEWSLQLAADVLKKYCSDDELAEVAKHGRLFVQMFRAPITASAPHIYLSALPFCPSNSRISQIYGPRYPHILSVVSGRRINWDTVVATSDAHEAGVSAISFFPDGKKLVSFSEDMTVRIWDVKTGQALSTPFTGHTELGYCIAVSPDGNQIVSGDFGGILRIWDSDTGVCRVGPIKAHSGTIWSVAFSPNGLHVVSGSEDNTVKVWNVATGELILGPLVGHTNDIMSVTFSPDGAFIVSGSLDKRVIIWDAHTGASPTGLMVINEHTSHVCCVAFSPNGRYLVSGSADETIRLWDVTHGFAQMSASVAVTGNSVYSLAFSPDGECLVSGSENGALCFWSLKSVHLEQIEMPRRDHTASIQSVAFSPDGLSVASASSDGSIKISRAPNSTSLLPGDVAKSDSSSASLDSLPTDPQESSTFSLSDESFIDKDGWMRASRRDGAGILFWVPRENRGGVSWPRNTVVVHQTVTTFDFSRFVHGDKWEGCCRALETEVVH